MYDGEHALTDRERKKVERNLARALKAAADDEGPDGPLGSALERALGELELDEADRRAVEHRLTTEIEQDLGADAGELSRKSWDEGAEERGDDLLLRHGYDGILDELRHRIEIRPGHEVTAIHHGGGGEVRVATSRGELTAPHVVVTLPIGVLKARAVAFDPPLPAPHLEAIARLGSGLLDKLYLRFPKVFWPEDVEVFGRIAKPHGDFASVINYHAYLGAPVLMWLHAGSAARRAEAKTDRELVAGAMTALRQMFGDVVEPEAWRATRWNADPFALGSYSYLPPGATRRHRIALGAPVRNRLFFAGEATEPDFPATVRGAYVSGRREAARILAL